MQAAQSGSSLVPPRTGAVWPQPRAAGPALLAGLAPRLAGRLGDISTARGVPQIEQVIVLTGAQAGHSGPSAVRTLTGRRRPQPTQVSWLAGSVIRQCGHSGRPCSSRVAASRTAPHRAQGSDAGPGDAVAARPLPADPPVQRDDPAAAGAGGRTIPVAPASQSSLDQPQHRRDRCLGAGAGEQPGLVLQGPGQLTALPGPGGGRRAPPRPRASAGSAGIDRGDDLIDDLGRVLAASSGGHCAHRGCPSRSRKRTCRVLPQAAQGSRRGPQTPQYQSCPRRCRVRRSLPHSAQTGGEIAGAPALRSAISRSPTTRGAGDRPSVSTDGRCRQRLGELAPLGPAAGDAGHDVLGLPPGPAPARPPATRSTTTPTGSASTLRRVVGGHRLIRRPG